MMGKTWMYNANVYHFQSFDSNGKLVLQTDKKVIEIDNQPELNFFIKDCKPVEPPASKITDLITPPNIESDNIMAQLKGVLMEKH